MDESCSRGGVITKITQRNAKIFVLLITEIYRIVSQKQLPEGPASGGRPGGGDPINIVPGHPENNQAKKPCCNN
jgi:hypothetical protein